ncbi:MAG: glycosyltransferase family 39 protein [Saprospiraceae bacterium]|nr:glycosyltransferase family 39 protein [Saprospiraceae bacterium]
MKQLESRSRAWQKAPVVLVYPVLLAAAVSRVLVWLQQRSLFIDEANLARNFCEKGPADFFQPLSHEQFAPPFFSLVQWINVQAFGHQELSLRLFPLLCGLLSIALFYRIARQLIDRDWVLLAVVWIFCFSDFFLRYATEGKQYSSDMAVSLGLVFLGLRTKGRFARTWWAMVLGAVVVWFSMPAVFVLFGLGMYAAHQAWAEKDRTALRRLTAVFAVWLLSFGLYYRVLLNQSLAVAPLINYHKPWFLPLFPTNAAEWRQWADLLSSFPYYTAGYTFVAKLAGGAGMLTGLVWLFRRKQKLAWLIAVPVLVCLLASGLEKYSLIPRMLVWAFPLALILQGLGWQQWWKAGRAWYFRAIFLLLFGLTAGLHRSWQYFALPFQIEEVRPVLDDVREAFQPGDVLVVNHEAWPAVVYYRDCHSQRAQYQFDGRVLHVDWNERPDLQKVSTLGAKPRRVWLVFSHVVSEQARAAMQADVALTNEFATQKKVVERAGAFAYLLEMSN